MPLSVTIDKVPVVVGAVGDGTARTRTPRPNGTLTRSATAAPDSSGVPVLGVAAAEVDAAGATMIFVTPAAASETWAQTLELMEARVGTGTGSWASPAAGGLESSGSFARSLVSTVTGSPTSAAGSAWSSRAWTSVMGRTSLSLTIAHWSPLGPAARRSCPTGASTTWDCRPGPAIDGVL